MASIRVPQQAESLLCYCSANSSIKDKNIIFDTYAQLTAFAAAAGFYAVEKHGRELPKLVEFLEQPNPIELEIFINRELFTPLTSIAIAHTKSIEILSDQPAFCKLIERYATAGFILLKEMLHENGSPNFVTGLARLLEEAAEEDLVTTSEFI